MRKNWIFCQKGGYERIRKKSKERRIFNIELLSEEMKRKFCPCKEELVRTKEWLKGDIMAKIDRSNGIKLGTGYLMGSEIYGKTEILDEIVQQAAERMLQMFDVDITIRFNFDAESGGAYVKDEEWSDKVGIRACLVNAALYKMNCQEKSRLSDEEWKKYYNKDLIKIGTCLYRKFLKPDIKPLFGDTEFRDFDNLDKAAEWLLTATNERMWKYVAQIKFGKPGDLKVFV